MPQADTAHYLSQSFWLVVCFGSVWALMHFWIVPVFGRILSQRQDSLAQLIEKQQSCVQQTQDLQIQIQHKLDKARQDGQRIVQEAQTLAQKAVQEAAQEASSLYEMRLVQLRSDLAQDQEKACLEVRQRADELVRLCLKTWNLTGDAPIGQAGSGLCSVGTQDAGPTPGPADHDKTPPAV